MAPPTDPGGVQRIKGGGRGITSAVAADVAVRWSELTYLPPGSIPSRCWSDPFGRIRSFGSAGSAPLRTEPSAPPLPVPTDYHSTNKWKLFWVFLCAEFHKGTTVRLGRANGNVGRRTASLWLWLRGREEETRTRLSQMESKMDAERCCSLGERAGAADEPRLQEGLGMFQFTPGTHLDI